MDSRLHAPELILAGGTGDPNLIALHQAANFLGIATIDVRHDPNFSPRLRWMLDDNVLQFNDQILKPTCAFIRLDVFAGLSDPRPEVETRAAGWYHTFHSWLIANPAIGLLNRDIKAAALHKPSALLIARDMGLTIPQTIISNDIEWLSSSTLSRISKPVSGGDYCVALDQILTTVPVREGLAAMPSIVQERLDSPEMRIYIIGETPIAFHMNSRSLDYRVHQDVDVSMMNDPPIREVTHLISLMKHLGMDFGAADFKTDPQSGSWVFLELNTSPMFAKFSQISDGRLAREMVQAMMKKSKIESVL